MAKNFDLAQTLNAGLSRSMDDEKKYTAERLEKGDLSDFHALARSASESPPAAASSGPEAGEAVEPSMKTKRTASPREAKRVKPATTASGSKSRMSYLPSDADNTTVNGLVGRAYSMNRRLTMSQILRVAVHHLAELNDRELLDAIDATPDVARGRPKQ